MCVANNPLLRNSLLAFVVLVLVGCAGTESFSRYARAGDTVSLAVGWRQNLDKSNISIAITPASTETPIVYGPDHPAIRAVFNLYPDPLSSVVVSPQVGEDLTPYAQQYAGLMAANYTGADKDLSQTVVFLDLPADLPVGRTNIQVSGGGYADPPAATVQVIEGLGFPASFSTEGGGLTQNQLRALERVDNYRVTFSGEVVPHAIQVDFRHDPDRDFGGLGKAYVVNPRGDVKSVIWDGDGVDLRVLLMPAESDGLDDLLDFKFYIAGGVTGLHVVDVRAYGSDGSPVPGITASIE